MRLFAVIQPEPAVANTTTVLSTSYTTIQVTVAPIAASTSAIPTSKASVGPASSSSSSSSTYYAPPSSSSPVVAVVVSSTSSSAPVSTSSTSSPGTSGSQWCMTYSPYTSSGGCKDSGSIASDVAAIASKGFSSVRLYSTDCDGLSAVGSAVKANGLKLVLGIYISSSGISGATAQVTEITSWASGDYSIVEMLVVGNEAIFNGYCDASSLASFISSTKSTLQAAGFTGPVTTTEPINTLSSAASALCPVIDVLAANIHPFFNPDIDASGAGSFVATSLSQLAALCPGETKEAYNLETGWPHSGEANGAAVPGESQQAIAIKGIQEMAGGKSAFFSFVDDLWKAEGEFNVEQSWGCSQLFADH